MKAGLLVAIPVVAAAVWVGAAQSRRVDDNALRNAWQSGDWVTYGNDLSERRYSPLDQINASTVDRLGLVWTAGAGAGGGNQEATPLVWKGFCQVGCLPAGRPARRRAAAAGGVNQHRT